MIGIGGDHLLSWCVLRAARDFNNGEPVALIHLDSHLDTGDEYMGNKMRYLACKKNLVLAVCLVMAQL